jgi:hypothetical protein
MTAPLRRGILLAAQVRPLRQFVDSAYDVSKGDRDRLQQNRITLHLDLICSRATALSPVAGSR